MPNNLIIVLRSYIRARSLIDYEILRSTVRNFINLFFKERTNKAHDNFIKHNSEKYVVRSSKNKILVDYFPVPQWLIVNAVLANEISRINNAELVSFNFVSRAKEYDAIYKSFGCGTHLRVLLNPKQRFVARGLFINAIKSIKSKNDLLNYCIDGVNVGLDIYESILRNANVPTVSINDRQTYKHILWGIEYYLFAKMHFSHGNCSAVLLSHDNYISMGTIAKVAHRYGVDVYLGNIHEIIRPKYAHHLYQRFRFYPNIFNRLAEKEKYIAKNKAMKMLERRINGEVGVRMSYQTKSAFTTSLIPRQTTLSSKVKIVVATHCFFDNPHGYGGMLFPDFYEWLTFLGNLSEYTDYEWYLKVHRDFLDASYNTLVDLCKKFPKFKIVDPEVSWKQLRDEGVITALTCYGSIGHELPLLGFTVINAAYNPHIAYKFNIHAKTVDEYHNIILNLQNIKLDIEVDEIYSFFYTHTELTQPDQCFFESNEAFFNQLKLAESVDHCYDLYIQQAASFDSNVRKYLQRLEKNKTFVYE